MKMKNNLKSLTFLSIMGVALFLGSCKNNNQPGPISKPKNLYQTIASDTSLSLLRAAINIAGLATPLQGTTNFSVFAPVNSSFRNIGLGDSSTIAALGSSGVASLLEHHLIVSKVSFSNLSTSGSGVVYPTDLNTGTQPDSLYFSENSQGNLFINGNQFVSLGINATNGVVYLLPVVLNNPYLNIYEFIKSTVTGHNPFYGNNPLTPPNDFTVLNAALNYVSSNPNTNLISQLQGKGPFTFLAPNDAAFAKSGITITNLTTLYSPSQVYNILSLHVIPGLFFIKDFISGTYATLNLGTSSSGTAEDVKISTLNSPPFQGPGNNANYPGAGLSPYANLSQGNGVIHVITNVLLP